jgi:hypothetical protein
MKINKVNEVLEQKEKKKKRILIVVSLFLQIVVCNSWNDFFNEDL